MSNQREMVEALEARAAKANVSMAHVCRLAGVAVSGPPRWKAGTVRMLLDSYHRLDSALLKIEADFNAANTLQSGGSAADVAPLPPQGTDLAGARAQCPAPAAFSGEGAGGLLVGPEFRAGQL